MAAEQDELPPAWAAAMAAAGDELLQEVSQLEEMPQVEPMTGRSLFDRAKPAGSKAQLRGVIIRVSCCGVQVDQKCNDKTTDDACPTHIDAVRLLRAKVQAKHGSADCIAKASARAEEARAHR